MTWVAKQISSADTKCKEISLSKFFARGSEIHRVENGLKARFPLGEFIRATRSENKNPAT